MCASAAAKSSCFVAAAARAYLRRRGGSASTVGGRDSEVLVEGEVPLGPIHQARLGPAARARLGGIVVMWAADGGRARGKPQAQVDVDKRGGKPFLLL